MIDVLFVGFMAHSMILLKEKTFGGVTGISVVKFPSPAMGAAQLSFLRPAGKAQRGAEILSHMTPSRWGQQLGLG